MKKGFLVCLLLLLAWVSQAQHCGFDGAYMLVVKLVDQEGNIITEPESPLILVETDNPWADSCAYSKGLLELPFMDASSAINHSFASFNPSYILEKTEACSFMQKGYWAVILRQDEHACMIPQGRDFNPIERKFVVRMKKGEEFIILSGLNQNDFHPLCIGYGPWSRIQAVNMVVE